MDTPKPSRTASIQVIIKEGNKKWNISDAIIIRKTENYAYEEMLTNLRKIKSDAYRE